MAPLMGMESVISNSGSMAQVISLAGKKVRKPTVPLAAMGPAQELMQVMDYTTLPNGTYTIYARATANDGRLSDIVSKTFILNFPPTPTPTITNTPTATPLPSCNDVFITDSQVRDHSSTSDFRVTVRNNNQACRDSDQQQNDLEFAVFPGSVF